MARPRTPAKILELRGAFKKHPERRRKDAEGRGQFETEPPAHLPQFAVPAWRWIVDRVPLPVLSSSDEVAVEQAALCLAGMWELGKLGPAGILSQSFKQTSAELRQWLQQLGMTPQARTKIPPAPDDKPTGNPFSE